jgi:hypothetical protein
LFPTIEDNILLLLEFLMPVIILPIALASTLFSVRMTNLWVRLPRPEKLLEENLKGLGSKAVLYSYYHFPARHVLICQQGVFAIVTRFQNGTITVNGDKWTVQRSFVGRLFSIFRMDSVGNPTIDAVAAAGKIQSILETIVPNVKVQPIVVFIDPNVKLTVLNPTVPVVNTLTRLQPNLKDYLKGLPKKNELTPDQIRQFEAATGVIPAKN